MPIAIVSDSHTVARVGQERLDRQALSARFDTHQFVAAPLVERQQAASGSRRRARLVRCGAGIAPTRWVLETEDPSIGSPAMMSTGCSPPAAVPLMVKDVLLRPVTERSASVPVDRAGARTARSKQRRERRRAHHGTVEARGNVKWNAVPRPDSLSAQIRPPWASTMPLAMDRPRPRPGCFVVPVCQNRSKIALRCSSAMPGPVSVTENRASLPCGLTAIAIWPSGPVYLMALLTRFASTCRMRPGSQAGEEIAAAGVRGEDDAVRRCRRRKHLQCLRDQAGCLQRLDGEPQLARVQAGQVHQVVDQPR
jgi:hypothetical protein